MTYRVITLSASRRGADHRHKPLLFSCRNRLRQHHHYAATTLQKPTTIAHDSHPTAPAQNKTSKIVIDNLDPANRMPLAQVKPTTFNSIQIAITVSLRG